MKKFTFVLDIDGVMTTGQFLYSERGKEYKIFGPHDADGLKMIRNDVNIVFLTSDKRGFPISKKRIEDMGYPIELASEQERYEYVKKKYGFENTIYMGDGIFDVPIIRDCRVGIAPANARKEAKEVADYITESSGGNGAVCDASIYIRDHVLTKTELSYPEISSS